LKTSVGADWSPNNVLERVAPHLEGDILLAALDATAVIADDKERVDALRTAIPFVNPEVVRLVLNHASHVGDERARGSLLTSIADRADDESIDLLIAQVRSIEWRSWRVEPLEHLLPSLSADRRSEVLEDLLVAANDLGFESDRVKTLGRVVRMMPPDLIDRGLWLARGIEAPGLRSEALLVLSRGTQATLGETDRDALLNEALETAYDVEDAFSRTFLLAEAATFYPPGDRRRVLWEEALSSARSTPDLETRAHLFRLLAARSSGEEERRSLFSESLHNAQQIESVSRRASAILPLVHDLTSGDRDAFIADVHRTRPTVESLTIVEKLIEVYRDEDAAFALSILDACDPGWGTTERIRLLEMIAGSLTDVTPFVDRFVDECRAIDTHHVERASLLLELARRLGRPNGVRAIDEAIQLLRSADSPVKRTELLAVVAEHLPSGERALVIGETLREAQQIENVFDRAWTLWTLGTLLSSSERYAVWHEALRCFNSESRKDVLALFRATCATPSTPSDLLGRMAALVVEVDERWSWL